MNSQMSTLMSQLHNFWWTSGRTISACRVQVLIMWPFSKRLRQLMSQNFNFFVTRNLLDLDLLLVFWQVVSNTMLIFLKMLVTLPLMLWSSEIASLEKLLLWFSSASLATLFISFTNVTWWDVHVASAWFSRAPILSRISAPHISVACATATWTSSRAACSNSWVALSKPACWKFKVCLPCHC